MSARSVRSRANVFSLPTDLSRAVRLDGAIVDAARELLQPFRGAADDCRAGPRSGRVRTSTSFSIPCARSRSRGDRADAPQRVDWQPLEKAFDALGRDHRQAIRLVPARRDLGQKLVRRHARRRRQPGRVADRRFQPLGDPHAQRLAPGVLGHVEIGLVERERLDERRDACGRSRTPVFETARYRSKAGRTITRCGHSRTARAIGMADRTPNARAS